jgi:SAM-dependent methyltransferase
MSAPDKPLADVAGYYASRLAEHGETPRGVDWNGEESQVLRFEQLARVIDPAAAVSVNDVGCGYGALYGYLAERYTGLAYCGCDIAPEMVAAARARHAGDPAARFVEGAAPPAQADYSIASGIFNVRLQRPDAEWLAYILATLEELDRASTKGFAFNCLTSYSDAHKMRDYLYYADPCRLFDHCKRAYSRDVALLHDYGLYEFTILVRKPR